MCKGGNPNIFKLEFKQISSFAQAFGILIFGVGFKGLKRELRIFQFRFRENSDYSLLTFSD